MGMVFSDAEKRFKTDLLTFKVIDPFFAFQLNCSISFSCVFQCASWSTGIPLVCDNGPSCIWHVWNAEHIQEVWSNHWPG